MKKITSSILILVSLSTSVFADCDFSKVSHNPDGTMTYSKELHICVGQMKQDLESTNAQLDAYKKAMDLKDLALLKADARANMWMETTFKLQDRMNVIDDLKARNQYLAFGLGVLVTGLAVWGAGQLAPSR